MSSHSEGSAFEQVIDCHFRAPKPHQPPVACADYCRQITDHVQRHVGPVSQVLHEFSSHLVHIDLLVVEPTAQQPYYTLVTSGMSDRPMIVPHGVHECQYAELAIRLPADWPVPAVGQMVGGAGVCEPHHWPIGILKFLARLPHEYDTWLWWGHSIPNGEPPQPFAGNTQLSAAMLLPSVTLPEAFEKLTVHDDKQIHFFSLYPLYREELELKLTEGIEALLYRLETAGVTDVLDFGRPNTCGGLA